MSESKYKVGDKFIIEVAKLTEDENFPYLASNNCMYPEKYFESLERYEPHDSAEDAWELLRQIYAMTSSEALEVFSETGTLNILMHNTYTEVKEKYKTWQESKKIQIGDEIKRSDGVHGIVMKITGERLEILTDQMIVICPYANHVKKTGRHYDLSGLMKFLEEKDG